MAKMIYLPKKGANMLESVKKILSYIPKLLQILLFVIIFLLALKNTQIILLDVYLARFQMPLILLMVALLMIGMLMGFLLTLPRVYRLKQKLKQALKDLDENIAAQNMLQKKNNLTEMPTNMNAPIQPNTDLGNAELIDKLPPQP